MSPDLESYFLTKYTKLFDPDEIRLDPMQSCMCWGFECGDGWYRLLDEAFKALAELDPLPTIAQVKEKFGTLRLYISYYSDEAEAIIQQAEELSARTCEICGEPGKVVGHGWLSTRCEVHTSRRDK